MASHFNKLTPAEAERLAVLAEECGEVIQAVGKILRHGYASYHPDDQGRGDNRDELAGECGDVLFAIEEMMRRGDLDPAEVRKAANYKADSISEYLHHQPLSGATS